ncbi:thioredoxin family protein [Haladaptatus salinisoli]|uniref:thioredoxin family protein n=1 Tax=Haladaptatus salinisoli TaxID=2884876 RepID=UPI001D0B0EFB|nr:thioredoxin family protein [Haladaptatus salinisoli]
MESTEPNPTWDASAHSETVSAIESGVGEVTYRVWGADWCGDCRSALPDFFAALDAAGVPEDEIHVYEVDEEKDGELVEEYGVTLIPTIVVERSATTNRTATDDITAEEDDEIVRFEEEESLPAAEYVADELLESDVLA